jgi:pseudaminic acid cytidylyltransferase
VTARALATIIARGGSKRIPGKNIKNFLGIPIISYSISAALKSGLFKEVMVSTDDESIAQVALRCGAAVPFRRSAATSGDHATSADVLLEVLGEYRRQGCQFEEACLLYATAPYVTPDLLSRAYALLRSRGADSVLPVVRFAYPIQRALRVTDGILEMIWKENYNKRSQDLPPTFHDAGQFCWVNVRSFLEQKILMMRRSVALEVPESESQDIDNEEDWKIAELKYQIIKARLGLDSNGNALF